MVIYGKCKQNTRAITVLAVRIGLPYIASLETIRKSGGGWLTRLTTPEPVPPRPTRPVAAAPPPVRAP